MKPPRTAAPDPAAGPVDLYGCTRTEVAGLLAAHGLSPVHARRIWNRLYLGLAPNLAGMTEVPPRVLEALAPHARVGALPPIRETRSSDGFTRKFVLEAPGPAPIETVLMRYTGRVTACVSSQAGCAMGCVFCATGQQGFTRNLTAGEIVAQAVHVARSLQPGGGGARTALRNIVLMGMGEPLLNYDAVMRAADILRDPSGLALGSGHITLSTVGVIPGIIRMADEGCPIHLAVSLHAATQEERSVLVPSARAWPLSELIDACRHFCIRLRRRIFFEWTLIDGRNDGADQAHAVGRLLSGLLAQVNLIPLNPTAGYDGGPGGDPAARRFQRILGETYGIPATIRQRRGIDIAAGCGQLAGESAGTLRS